MTDASLQSTREEYAHNVFELLQRHLPKSYIAAMTTSEDTFVPTDPKTTIHEIESSLKSNFANKLRYYSLASGLQDLSPNLTSELPYANTSAGGMNHSPKTDWSQNEAEAILTRSVREHGSFLLATTDSVVEDALNMMSSKYPEIVSHASVSDKLFTINIDSPDKVQELEAVIRNNFKPNPMVSLNSDNINRGKIDKGSMSLAN